MAHSSQFKANCKLASDLMSTYDSYKRLNAEQRAQILQKRIGKFFGQNQHIDVSQEHYKRRLQPIYEEDTQTCNDTLILFGIDFLNHSSIKTLFSMEDPTFECTYLDASNCMLRYSSPKFAISAIKAHLKTNSDTRFKIEESACQQTQQRSAEFKPPKKWIELEPYIYRFHYKDKNICPDAYNDFSRKLLVRYATIKEKEEGKIALNQVEQLYQQCKKIWTSEALKHKELQTIVKEKLEQFKNKKPLLTRIHLANRQSSSALGQKGSQPPPARQSSERQLDESFIESRYQPQMRPEQIPLHSSPQPSQHSQRLNSLVKQMKKINLDCESGKSVSQIAEQIDKLNFQDIHDYFPCNDIPYQVAKPNQLRFSSLIKDNFNYGQYVSKSAELSQKILKYCEIDLTQQ